MFSVLFNLNVVCKNLLTSLQAAEGNSLYEEDEELTCNLCQRRFEEQGISVAPDATQSGDIVLEVYSAYV